MRATDRLRQTPVPGEDEARARAWNVARAALAERAPVRRRRRRIIAAAAAPAVAAAALVFAATAPGDAVGDWVRAKVRSAVGAAPAARAPRAAAGVPGGRLLSAGRGGVIVLGTGPPRRILGDVGDATWSPHGLFVAATRRCELIAVDVGGRRRWSLCVSGGVADPAWSPS
jgi:hypothetical protein